MQAGFDATWNLVKAAFGATARRSLLLPLLFGGVYSRSLGATLALLMLLVVLLRGRQLHDPVVIAFLASGALPWLASDLGMLDAWMLTAILGAVLLARRGSPAAIPVCAFVPLIHEAGLWLLLPVLAGIWLLRPEARRIAMLGAGAAMTAAAAIWMFSTTDFAWPAGTPSFDPEQLAGFVRWQLGQSPKLYLPAPTLQNLLFSVLPCAGIVAAVWRQAGPLAALMIAAGVCVTWSLIFVGIDTDRFFAWGPLTAVMLAAAARGCPSAADRYV